MNEDGYLLMYADEASVSLTPPVSRTFALRGHTPRLAVHTGINQRIYIISAIGPQGEMEYQVSNKAFTGKTVVGFLKHLRKKINRKILLVWDGASIHFADVVKKYLMKLPDNDLCLVRQPSYSSEVNPDEQVWAYLKSSFIKNRCFRDIKELKQILPSFLDKIKNNPELIASFFRHPDVGFYKLSS